MDSPKKTIALLRVALMAALVLAGPATAEAATVRASVVAGCDLELVGTIDDTEVAQLRRLVAGTDNPVLCLDSPGGALTGGLALFDAIPQLGVITRIPAGWHCASACSLAFMAGRGESGLGMGTRHAWVGHILEAGGMLGFHAPGLDLPAGGGYSSEQVQAAFQIAQTASNRLYRASLTEAGEWRAFNEFILGRIFETPPAQMFYIETVADAVLGQIGLGTVRLPDRITRTEIAALCDAAFLTRAPLPYRTASTPATDAFQRVRYQGLHDDPEAAARRLISVSRTGNRIHGRVEGYDQRQAMRGLRCEVTLDLADITPDSYQFSYWAGNGAEITLWEAEFLANDGWSLFLDEPVARFPVPLWYMHRPDTAIASLTPRTGGAHSPQIAIGQDITTQGGGAMFRPTHRVHSLDTGYLNLRQGPGNDQPVLRRMDHGLSVQVGEINARGWASVTTREGQRGWAYGRYLVALD